MSVRVKQIAELSLEERSSSATVVISNSFANVAEAKHGFVFDDIVPGEPGRLMTNEQCESLLALVPLVTKAPTLTIACDGGMCRSTAAAVLLSCLANPSQPAEQVIRELADVHPEGRLFWPNDHMIKTGARLSKRLDIEVAVNEFKLLHATCWIESDQIHTCE